MDFDFRFEGNLAADAELEITETGRSLCKLRVAHTRRRRTKDGEWENLPTMWVTVTTWGDLAERCAKWKKGNTVMVICRDDLEPWAFTRRDTGEAGAMLQVTAANVGLSARFEDVQVVEAEQPASEPWAVAEPDAGKTLEPAF